jgi:putative aldouronate transport system permease protein
MFLAILINAVDCKPLKKSIQTIIYIPHFFTWVVVYSIFYIVFNSGGLINTIIVRFSGKPILFFMSGPWLRILLVISDMWHSAGWGTIVYLAAITGIDSETFDAATVDGADRLQQIRHIMIPCLMPTLILMLSIRLGHIMTDGFDQVLAFYNPSTYESVDIIGTYVYRTGIGQANFSYATAVGLFNSLIGLIMVLFSNCMSRRVSGRSIW